VNARVRIPGKTFLLGEYAILDGGLCLGAATEPYFEAEFRSSSSIVGAHPFHENSPAGRYFTRYAEIFKGWEVLFHDPRQGQGGLGASTAQYLALWIFREGIRKNKTIDNLVSPDVLGSLVQEYRELAVGVQGRVPSGADLVVQLLGGIHWIDTKYWTSIRTLWPWADLSGYLIFTGVKIPTHEHLEKLTTLDASGLHVILQDSRKSFFEKDRMTWLETVTAYQLRLRSLGFSLEVTEQRLMELHSHSALRAAKGCGALGADVIFAAVDSSGGEDFENFLQSKNLKYLSLLDSVSTGASFDIEQFCREESL